MKGHIGPVACKAGLASPSAYWVLLSCCDFSPLGPPCRPHRSAQSPFSLQDVSHGALALPPAAAMPTWGVWHVFGGEGKNRGKTPLIEGL